MIVHRIPRRRPRWKRYEIIFRPLQGLLNALVDVVTLLEVDVFEQVAAHRTGGNGIPVHVDSGEVRNRAFYRLQSFAQIFVDARVWVGFCHSNRALNYFGVSTRWFLVEMVGGIRLERMTFCL